VNVVLRGTASEGADYASIGSTVTIPAGASSLVVPVAPVDDVEEEDEETATVTLASGAGYVVAAPANATVSLSDDERIALVPAGDTWRYFKGTIHPGASWAGAAFDDSAWASGPASIGYGDGDDATVLTDMQNSYVTVYLRRDFSLSDASSVAGLSLDIDFDDGFVAFLNGQEVARSGVDPGQDHTTEADNHEAGQPEEFDLTPWVGLLQTGTNVLAVEIHNQALDSSDLSVDPALYRLGGLGVSACANGADDDGDGAVDFPDDPGCADATDPSERSSSLECDDGFDDDGDGLADHPQDPGCLSPADTSEREDSLACDDGIDNDGDGVSDVPGDPGCDDPTDGSEKSDALVCDDGADNDGDALADHPNDPGCDGPGDASENSPDLECDDGDDDDGDGFADFPADAGCTAPADGSEREAGRVCDDGVDDDGDGLADFPADPGCASASDDSELDPGVECDDGADNDGDGLTDFPADPGCDQPTDPDETDPPNFTLTITTTGPGKVAVSPSEESYAAGSVVTLKARPPRRFVAWGGDLSGNETDVTITIEADMAITATFVK
jgi:hypothetical protein